MRRHLSTILEACGVLIIAGAVAELTGDVWWGAGVVGAYLMFVAYVTDRGGK